MLLFSIWKPDHSATACGAFAPLPRKPRLSANKMNRRHDKAVFNLDITPRALIVKEGDTLSTGRHNLTFIAAPWYIGRKLWSRMTPLIKSWFSADAFGTFGALNGAIFADEVDFDRDYMDEARRYYTNIVGKYGPQVQAVLKKASGLEIAMLLPLHGFVWRSDLGTSSASTTSGAAMSRRRAAC